MQPRKQIFGLQDILALFAIISLTTFQMADFAIDPGVGWHLADGEYILKHEAVPRLDPFLASPTPRAWVSDQWLADVLMFTIYALGSWPLLYGFLTALFFSTYYAILYPLSVRLTGAPILTATLTLLAFKLGQIHFILRPVILGFFCFALLATLMWRREFPRPTARGVTRLAPPFDLLIIPLFVAWANLHPSFVLGLIALALRPVATTLDRLLHRRPTPERREILHRFRHFVTGALASCINPNGIGLHLSIVALGQDPFFMRYHEEWLPPDITTGVGLAFLLITIVLVISFILERAPRSFGSYEVLLLAVLGFLSFRSIRIVPFFAIAAVVPLARSLTHHTVISPNQSGVFGTLRAAWCALSNRHDTPTRGLVTVTLGILTIVLDPIVRGSVLNFNGPFGPPHARFPYGAVQKLVAAATPQKPTTVFAPPQWGGFITFFGGEFVRPLIDDRNTLLGADLYRRFEYALTSVEDLNAFLDAHRSSAVLLPRSLPLTSQLANRADFHLIYEDKVAFLYERPPAP